MYNHHSSGKESIFYVRATKERYKRALQKTQQNARTSIVCGGEACIVHPATGVSKEPWHCCPLLRALLSLLLPKNANILSNFQLLRDSYFRLTIFKSSRIISRWCFISLICIKYSLFVSKINKYIN